MGAPSQPAGRPLALQHAGEPQKQPLSGWIADVDAHGRLRVDFDGNRAGPLPAQTVVAIRAEDLAPGGAPTPVLLVFDRGNPAAPIIVGLLREAVLAPAAAQPAHGRLTADSLLFDAGQDITLRCGDASITLQADGRIVIKGSRLLSRASETNRIRGASVAIN